MKGRWLSANTVPPTPPTAPPRPPPPTGPRSLDDTIARLPAFEKAGAEVLMAPGLPDLAAVRAVCAAVSKAVNFMAGIKGKSFSVAELQAAGVRLISLAAFLYRMAVSGLVDAAREVADKGTFGYLDRSLALPDLARFMERRPADRRHDGGGV